jgi:GAF domain-containing protein
METAVSPDEGARLAAVRRYEILDTPPDGAFDRVTALAARFFGVPVAIVSIVDHDRIWFKSHHGLDVEQIAPAPGLCASAVLQDDPWVVNDALVDPRTVDNPLVAGELGLRFYAGVPLKVRGGFNLGVLNVIDYEPREVTSDELETLDDLASIVVDELELRLAARELHEVRRRRVLELNHDVVHGIATAKACLAIGETSRARRCLDEALGVAKRIVDETLAELA